MKIKENVEKLQKNDYDKVAIMLRKKEKREK